MNFTQDGEIFTYSRDGVTDTFRIPESRWAEMLEITVQGALCFNGTPPSTTLEAFAWLADDSAGWLGQFLIK